MAADPLVFENGDDLTGESLTEAFGTLSLRLKALEALTLDYQAAIGQIQGIGLQRLNDALLPVYQSLIGLAQLGAVFSTTSITPLTVGLGVRTLTVAEPDRDRFAAASYLLVQSVTAPAVRVGGRLQSYDRATGTLTVLVDQVGGGGGTTGSAWAISAAADASLMFPYIDAALAALVGTAAPGYDTLGEIADVLEPIRAAIAALGGLATPGLTRLGIGAPADATNPFSAKLNKALWTALPVSAGGTGDLRVSLNKEAAAKTLSLLLQTAGSGRAEIGLVGDDDLHVRVSPDGAAWTEVLRIDRTTGGLDWLAASTTIASAATVDLGAVTTLKVALSGAATVTSFGASPHRVRLLHFTGAATLTHNAASLVLPGGVNLVAAPGDRAIATSDASGNWSVWSYTRASGKPLTGPASADITDATATGRSVLTAATPAAGRAALTAAASGANADITSLSGLTAPLSIGQGGTGAATVAAAAAALGLATPSFRNRLLNGALTINQRGTGTASASYAAGTYLFDRWRAGANGVTLSWAAGANGDATVTITAGTLVQVVEGGLYLPEGGAYVLSWAGTATARVYQGAASGAYAASPVRVSGLTAGTTATVEIGPGTLGLVQLEPGTVVTAFERRDDELRRCWRYYQPLGTWLGVIQETNAALAFLYGKFATMRAVPTATLVAPSNYLGRPNVSNFTPSSIAFSGLSVDGGYLGLNVPTQTAGVVIGTNSSTGIMLSSEL